MYIYGTVTYQRDKIDLPSNGSLPQMATIPRLCQAKSRRLEAHPGLPRGYREPNTWAIFWCFLSYQHGGGQKQPGLQSMPIWDVVMSAPVFLLKKKKKVAVCMLGEVLVPLLYSSFQPTHTLGWADGSSPGILDLIWDYETRVAFLALAWPCHSHTDASRVNQRISLNKQKSCFNECNVLIG